MEGVEEGRERESNRDSLSLGRTWDYDNIDMLLHNQRLS